MLSESMLLVHLQHIRHCQSVEFHVKISGFLTFRSLWEKESELSSEIERLKSEVIKAEKSLDHATPGVRIFFYFFALDFILCHLIGLPLLVDHLSYSDKRLLML